MKGDEQFPVTENEILKKYFGYQQFRGGQQELIEATLSGQDVLGVMPTGAGKSVCFQVPALMLSGITLVVSPLVSLMKDQVGGLVQLGIGAAYINSTLTPRQMEAVLYNAGQGQYKLIYVAPERLLNPDFLAFAMDADISLLTVDEAHCVSQWGQDFRPSYLQIAAFVEALPRRPILSAFTATATPQVSRDIVSALALKSPRVLVSGFDRENLYFSVENPRDKLSALLAFLEKNPESAGIVYCLTRKTVEAVTQALVERGLSAARYHAGLSDRERHANQDDFLFDRVRVMVATNAFGMGIDKSNVAFVVHYNMPKDLESYYQEVGRAGRDGSHAQCLLLYSPQDVRTNQWLIETSKDRAVEDSTLAEELKEKDYHRLRQMTFYATTTGCLRGFILEHFGEKPPSYCGNCGNCDTQFETTDVTIEAQKILSCVHRMGERFGITMVIAVLRGQDTQRIRDLGLTTLSTYGISQQSVAGLRAIIGYLSQEGYLYQTDEQYSVLKLTPNSREVLRGEVQLTMKLAKERAPATKERGRRRALPQESQSLYQRLRSLRGELAAEQGVPVYVIFTDKTLEEMCEKKPETPGEFLEVSGVGERKLARYGERFLGEISAFLGRDAQEVPVQRGTGERQSLSPAVLAAIPLSEEAVSISTVAKAINGPLEEACGVKVSAVGLGKWLVEQGLLQMEQQETGSNRTPTPKGLQQGIQRESRQGKDGTYFINLYPKAIQQLLIENLPDIVG